MHTFLTGLSRLFIVFYACHALLSCQSKTSEKAETTQNDSVSLTSTCYRFATKNDTVTLHAAYSGTSVSGTLEYNLDGKDRNKGTITGTMRGDTLLANYTFRSEGLESVREIIFLKRDSVFAEGYGTMTDKNGRMVFDDLRTIKFGDGIILGKITCK